MINSDCSEFKWDVLLNQIHAGNVIPVIGYGLYWMETKTGERVLLYDYLAAKMAENIGIQLDIDSDHKFHKIASRFLKENSSSTLKLFMEEIFQSLQLFPGGPLWKLARIKPFSIFINTSYDTYLLNTIKAIRNTKTEFISYTVKEKGTRVLNPNLSDFGENVELTLLCNIYGSIEKNLFPAYLEKDLLETLVCIKVDMEQNPDNRLFQALKNNSLLFVGCGYDDWLFRFFIRTIANEPYQTSRNPQKLKFICDFFNSPRMNELATFLKEYNSEIFYSSNDIDFVDILFMKLGDQYPDDIIAEEDFPGNVFIGFHEADRRAAVHMASLLREDGIKVWLDERVIKPGDDVEKTTVKAIEKCPVFIPLISRATKQFKQQNGVVKYHIREWEWAYSRHVAGENPTYIMPVIIDDTDWIYEPFKNKIFIHIPGGNREGDYYKLKDQLLEIQNKKS